MGHYVLNLSGKWITGPSLDILLKRAGDPHASGITSVCFNICSGCSIFMDAAPRLLSLANQLSYHKRAVLLNFEDGTSGVMGYLDRMGFLDLLRSDIKTVPERPTKSGATIYGGTNLGVVEFSKINPSAQNQKIPSKLADALENAYSERADKTLLGRAAFTVFGELIDNIYEHSDTKIDGYAAFQVYAKKALVVVSDSGDGLLNTLRPTLRGSSLAELTDPELIAYMMNKGVSRHGEKRGSGLRQSAEYALKYKAELGIRLPNASFRLIPGVDSYRAKAYGEVALPLIKGTHISFAFALDKS